MKPTFHARLVNSPFEDPCLYVRLLREKRAFIFDIGNISRLSPKSLLRVTDVFVSHTHIDHFIGFDSLLRVCLRREVPLRVFGPSNMIDAVEGKLRGYSWNLIHEYPLRLEVFAIDNGLVYRAGFNAESSFKRIDMGVAQFSGTLLEETGFRVRAETLHHDIPCLAYTLEEDIHINIDKSALTERGLPVGPWLSELKRAIREELPEDTLFKAGDKEVSLSEVKDIVLITKGQKLSYITDASPDEENIRKIIDIVKGSDSLFIEAYFLNSDYERAVQRNHLTAKIAGRIAREAGVKNLNLMHFSPKYKDNPETLTHEAMSEWRPNLTPSL